MTRPPSHGANITETHRTFGYLLRLPYARLAERVYGGLAARGFPEIRPAHGSLFRHIRADGSRLTELAEQAQMTKQSMAYLVDSLARSGHVETVPDPSDGRARLVRLTPRGREVWETLLALSREAEAELAGLLGARKAAQLRGLLEELAERLETAERR